MPEAHDSPYASQLVLVLGADDEASGIVSTLAADGLDAVRVASAPEALATLDAVDVSLVVVVEDAPVSPADLFGAAARNGHRPPGLYVGAMAKQLPPGVDQAPASPAAAVGAVRQRLLAEAAADADPAIERDPLETYGSTVSHELRNHVGAARLAVESLEGPTTEQALSALDRLETLATEAAVIAEKEVEDVESVALSEAGTAAADRFTAPDAKIVIETAQSIAADRDLLTLMIENLFRNAVEHGSTGSQLRATDAVEHGGGDVTIRVIDTENGFAVVDDGPGFESEDPFAWGYTTGDGQGAGLAVVRRIAEAHGWSVTASNEDGARVDVIL
jgi:signal transduction histidine kinase